MNLQKFSRLMLALLLAMGLAACSSSKRQNPVGSGEEGGQTTESFESGEEKPLTYVAKEGDTLKKIAGRPEIYSDPSLWPILQEANSDKLGQGTKVNPGMELNIPRDLTTEQIEEAKEKARQAAAAGKVRSGKAVKKKRVPIEEVEAKEKPKAEEAAAPTPVPAASVPKVKKGGMLMPVLLVLLVILGALAVILYFFMKRDNQENPQE